MVLAEHPNPSSRVLSHFSLGGKTALVTGGSRGIGLQIVTGLLEANASVAFTYTSSSEPEVQALVATLSKHAPDSVVKAYSCDVRDRASIFAVVKQAATDLGSLDIVVANAGIADHFPAEEYPEQDYLKLMDVNLNGAFWTAQAAYSVMKGSTTKGSIIFTASVSGSLVNIPQKQAPYNASKAAVIHLAKSLAVEWVDTARVNCVSPGFIATDMLDVHPKEWRDAWFQMIPGRRLCKTEELKGIYVFLASSASSYMTGANLIIDAGYTLP